MSNPDNPPVTPLPAFMPELDLLKAETSTALPGLVYHPESDAIVIKNGPRWDNRPLYRHERMATVTGLMAVSVVNPQP